MSYARLSDAAHTVATEDALKHWDKRRAADLETHSLPPQNIASFTGRIDAILRAVHDMERSGLDVQNAHVLDVGAAQGYGLRPFLHCGFSLAQLHGIDLFADRIAEGRRILPGIDLIHGDAAAMPYTDASFDIVCEQFCFCHIPDDTGIKSKIAKEMLRVTKPGGFILIHDWRIGSSSRKLYAVSQSRIREWFSLEIMGRYPSQLLPPIGRSISQHAPSLYQLAGLIPGVTGSWVTVLRR